MITTPNNIRTAIQMPIRKGTATTGLMASVACWVFALFQSGQTALPADTGQPREPVVLTGRVVDEQGAPVAGAKIQVAFSEIAAETDGTGRFRLAGLEGDEEYVLIFGAAGKAMCMQKVGRQRSPGLLEVTLRPGKSIQFRVLDREGKPVEDAIIVSQRWKGIFASRMARLRTDAMGRAAWKEAPADEIEYLVSKDGYARTVLRAAPTATEHAVTLNPLLIISGTVTNSASGEPIAAFRVVPVVWYNASSPTVSRSLAASAKSGRFSMEFARANVEPSVQIEAPGFLTVRSQRYRIGEPNPVLHFRMEPVVRALGRVVDGTGTPVGDARIYVATASQRFNVREIDRSGSDNYEVVTRDDGWFEIVPQFEDYSVVVNCARGCAKVDRPARETPGKIELQRWARVEGRLLQGGEPVPSWGVNLEPIRPFAEGQPLIADRLQAVTDKAGRFVFERVPPGPHSVRAELNIWEDSPLTSSSSIPLDPAPGQDIAVVLGGEGANVSGRVRLSQFTQTNIDYHFSLNYLLAKRPGIKPPPAIASQGFDWRKGWTDAWKSSAEGEAYLATLHHYFVKLAPNGSFRVGGLLPGEYELALKVYQPPDEGCLVYPLGTAVVRFRIEPGNDRVDLGEVFLEAMQAPKLGEQAPIIQFKELDGTLVNTGAFRGQYVLLDFWATWCGPCVRSLVEVDQLRTQYQKQTDLVVVGLNLDSDQEKAREFVRRRKLAWRHGFLGDWAQTDIPKRFAVSALPAYALIGPEGKLLAQSHKLEEMVPILESLARRSNEKSPLKTGTRELRQP
jgi:protocatechuate 3,4-dioxygenase beta subunit/thiol-disulfide isomerase/thioredoxin